jgi:glycosyltransferase involved in cell wall biosynthesis
VDVWNLRPKHKVVVGIPAFNEEGTIARIIVRTQKHADDIVVVDDGSTDETSRIAERLGARVVRHSRNLGYGAAIRSCFKVARELKASVLVTLDADGQHDPDDILKLIEPIKQGKADVVVGSRMLDKSHDETPSYRKVGVRLITRIAARASVSSISDAQSGMRAYGHKAIWSIKPSEFGMGASTEILTRAAELSLRVVEVPISIRYSGLKTSTHNPAFHGLDVLASILKFMSIRHPLIFYGMFASIAMFFSIVFGIWTLNIYFAEGRVVTSLLVISLIAGIAGIFSIFIGILLFTLISVIRGAE